MSDMAYSMEYRGLAALERLLDSADEIRQPSAANNVYALQRFHNAVSEVRELFGLEATTTATPDDAKDAARYRWLRERQPQTLACICWGHSSKACRISQGEGETRNDYIDRTLDAAMGVEQ